MGAVEQRPRRDRAGRARGGRRPLVGGASTAGDPPRAGRAGTAGDHPLPRWWRALEPARPQHVAPAVRRAAGTGDVVHRRSGRDLPRRAGLQRPARRDLVRAPRARRGPSDGPLAARVRRPRARRRAGARAAVHDRLGVVGMARAGDVARVPARRTALHGRPGSRVGRGDGRRRGGWVRHPQPAAGAVGQRGGARRRRGLARHPRSTARRRARRRPRRRAVRGGAVVELARRQDLGGPGAHELRRQRPRATRPTGVDRRRDGRSDLVPARRHRGRGGDRRHRARAVRGSSRPGPAPGGAGSG